MTSTTEHAGKCRCGDTRKWEIRFACVDILLCDMNAKDAQARQGRRTVHNNSTRFNEQIDETFLTLMYSSPTQSYIQQI